MPRVHADCASSRWHAPSCCGTQDELAVQYARCLTDACGHAVVLCNRCCGLRIHQRLQPAQSGCLEASSQGACSLSAWSRCYVGLQPTLASYSLLIVSSGSLFCRWLLQSASSGGESPLQLLTECGGLTEPRIHSESARLVTRWQIAAEYAVVSQCRHSGCYGEKQAHKADNARSSLPAAVAALSSEERSA